MRVAGIDACRHWHHAAKTVKQLGYLLERAAQRVLRAGGVLDRDLQPILRKIKTVSGATYGIRSRLPSDLARDITERPGMKHKVIGTERERPLQLAAKCLDGFLKKLRTCSCHVHQIAGVDHQRLQIVL